MSRSRVHFEPPEAYSWLMTNDDVRVGPAVLTPEKEIPIGAGRSGVVYKDEDLQGRIVARKVFNSDKLTKFVQYVLLGSPNPYTWNEHAVQCAVLRRRILGPLCEHWFKGRVFVASAWSQDFNHDYLAYQLHTEFVDGRPPTLHHPMNRRGANEVKELRYEIMAPLSERLLESGFDGMVWQAGLGNPVALGNFLGVVKDGKIDRWAWIDLESGVPALFPANPLTLFKFYLPSSIKFGRPLFDDVDIERLRSFTEEHRAELVESLGADQVNRIVRDTDSLSFHQHEWKSQPRAVRSITYALKKRRITAEQAELFTASPLRWYASELARVPGQVGNLISKTAEKLVGQIRKIPFSRLPAGAWGFLTSQRWRRKLSQKIVASRIDAWETRKQLLPHEATELRNHLESEESSAYLTDFGVHAILNPIMKIIEWLILPIFYINGLLSEAELGLAIVVAGPCARTIYTIGRWLQSFATGRELPWIALFTGFLPVVGNLAYPLQILYSSREEEDILAQFILYEGASAIGRKLPIWGGKDTLTEHVFNHLPDYIVRGRKDVADRALGDTPTE